MHTNQKSTGDPPMVNKTFCDRCNCEIKDRQEIYYFKLTPITINRDFVLGKEICNKCKNELMEAYQKKGAEL